MDPDVGSYKTLDNGGHPFRVEVTAEKKVTVWKIEYDQDDEGDVEAHDEEPDEQEVLLLSVQASKVFVGTSPENACTKFSAGFGPEWDGNNIIFQKADGTDSVFCEYYFVGVDFFKFSTISPIVYFTSPVGNNAVPYPWAQDMLGFIYLFADDTHPILTKLKSELPVDAPVEVKDQYDPYHVWWHRKKEDGLRGLMSFKYEHPETKKSYRFTWHPRHEERFDELTKFRAEQDHVDYHDEDSALELGKKAWCAVMSQYEDDVGIGRFRIIEIIAGGRE